MEHVIRLYKMAESMADSNGKIGQEGSRKRKLKFRNYNPQAEALQENKLPPAKPESIDEQIKEQLESGKQHDVSEITLKNLAPKKPDWDLKRDIAKQMAVLERRTQRAIVELIRERLQENTENTEDLAGVVANAEQPKNDEEYDSD